MRIGMMAEIYKPHISGVTIHIALNKQYMEKLGHEVFIFTFGHDDYKDNESNVIRSPGLPLTDTGFYLNIRLKTAVQKLIQTMDVVHAHHPFLSGRLAVRYCKPLGIPIVFTNHTRYDLYAQAYLPLIPDVIGETFLQAYLPSFFKSCDLIIAPSQSIKNILEKYANGSHIEFVPNGVDISPFTHFVEPYPRSQLGFSDKDIILIYVGRLGPEKNIPLLLRAFAGTTKAFDNIGLLILGDGPERENLEDRVAHMGIADRVKFTGSVPYEEIPQYLVTANAFVTASVTEVHPLTVIEAMASGLPVLGIQSPGVGDIVENGVNGLLASEEDVAAFTAKMVKMVTDHEMRQKFSRQAVLTARDYDIQRTSQLLLDQYQQLVSKRSSRKINLRNPLSWLIQKWKK
ncbi:MAG: glycosyltransferase [Anaerolineales bacterium]